MHTKTCLYVVIIYFVFTHDFVLFFSSIVAKTSENFIPDTRLCFLSKIRIFKLYYY